MSLGDIKSFLIFPLYSNFDGVNIGIESPITVTNSTGFTDTVSGNVWSGTVTAMCISNNRTNNSRDSVGMFFVFVPNLANSTTGGSESNPINFHSAFNNFNTYFTSIPNVGNPISTVRPIPVLTDGVVASFKFTSNTNFSSSFYSWLIVGV